MYDMLLRRQSLAIENWLRGSPVQCAFDNLKVDMKQIIKRTIFTRHAGVVFAYWIDSIFSTSDEAGSPILKVLVIVSLRESPLKIDSC